MRHNYFEEQRQSLDTPSIPPVGIRQCDTVEFAPQPHEVFFEAGLVLVAALALALAAQLILGA